MYQDNVTQNISPKLRAKKEHSMLKIFNNHNISHL